MATLGRELRSGRYDVVHIHEPNAGAASWYATEAARVPSVATFHTYSTSIAAQKRIWRPSRACAAASS